MCGITGLVKKNFDTNLDLKSTLLTMSKPIVHRGPDDYAEYINELCGMAIRRLAILDLSIGLYPFTSDDGKKILILNGEIYNFLDLKSELEQKGYNFKTNCDAEVIVKGFEEWGNGVFSKLRGMFAIALWDNSQKKLILVRDRLGIKPLYYINQKDCLLFSSEVKSFFNLNSDLYSGTINKDNLALLLGNMYLPKSEETILSGVNKLSSGHILEISEGNITLSKYWDLPDEHNIKNDIAFGDAKEQLETLLIESIKIHLLSDAPLGLMLSGGIDSSLIAAIIQKHNLIGNLKTFTAKFDHVFDESSLAKDTAAYLNTTHTEIFVDTSNLNNDIEKHISVFDDLTTFDGGILTTKLLCDLVAKNKTKVLLLGEGADEVFGGYSWFGLSKLPFNVLPLVARSALYYYATTRNVNFKSDFYVDFATRNFSDAKDIFTQISRLELKTQLPNHLLMKVDKGSMAASIEARVPYLDHKLVEFAYTLPSKYKLKGSFYANSETNEKFILRSIAQKYLPSSTVWRKKRGFLLPMNDVLQANIDKVKQYILSRDAVSNSLIPLKVREELFSSSTTKLIRIQKEYMLWRLFILEVWAKHFNLK